VAGADCPTGENPYLRRRTEIRRRTPSDQAAHQLTAPHEAESLPIASLQDRRSERSKATRRARALDGSVARSHPQMNTKEIPMKRFSALLFVLCAITALSCSIVAASASAVKVPGFLLLSLETGTLTFESLPKDEIKEGVDQNKIKSELQSTAGILTGEGVLLKITLNASSDDEGTFEALFLHVKKGTTIVCTGEGEKNPGEVLLSGTVKTVHDITETTGTGLLFEPTEITIACELLKIHVKGTALALFKGQGTEEGKDFKQWLGDLLCKNAIGEKIGEPADEKFWGLAGAGTALLRKNRKPRRAASAYMRASPERRLARRSLPS
jgi:hypothetical protein